MEERQTSRRKTEGRCLSASFIQYTSDKTLHNRKSWRETRTKPWKEAVPKYSKPAITLPDHKKKAISAAESKLLEEAWLEERNDEMWAINAKEDFKPLTVVLVSSQLQHLTCAEVLLALRETEHSLPIVYDYLHDTHSDIIDAVKQTLDQHGRGLRMERLVILCHGGPGHIYLLHKQIMTGAKIRKNKDIQWFWKEIGKLMSKRDNSRTTIILGGSNFMNSLTGLELMSDIGDAIKPNKASITALPMKRHLSPFEKDVVESIFVSIGAYLYLFKLIGPDVE